jgi:hypothetical protein
MRGTPKGAAFTAGEATRDPPPGEYLLADAAERC